MIKSFIKSLIQSILQHNIGYLAAAMSYFLFTSMIPILLLLTFGISLFIDGTKVEQFIDQLLQSYIPSIPSGGSMITTTIDRLSTLRPEISIIGFIGFFWGSIGGFVSLQQTLDVVSNIHHRRSFIKQYIVGFAMLALLLALVLVSLIVTMISPEFISTLHFTKSMSWIPIAHIGSHILLAITLFATCYFAYRFLPSKALPHIPLLIGAGFATVCIYISRALFVVYSHHLGNYQLIYGALTYVMLFSFWIYIVSMIFLLGMEITLAIHQMKTRT